MNRDITRITYLYGIYNNSDIVYVGITTDINRRRRDHLNSSSNPKVKGLIDTGVKLDVVTICIGEAKYIWELEKSYISTYGDQLYNIASGGRGGNGSEGESHWNSKLTEDDVITIRQLYASNTITQRDLALKYDVGYKAISKIVRGERWPNYGGPITLEKLSISKVANRAKLQKEDIEDIRNTAKFIYDSEGRLNIPKLASSLGLSPHAFRGLLKGIYYKEQLGPLLGIDYWSNFGRQ
jgi:hypothetical protein